MYTILLSLGQLGKSDIRKYFGEFAKLTSLEAVQKLLPTLSSLIDHFKCGDISEKEFFATLRKTLDPSEHEISIEQVVNAWNAMSTITPEVLDDLRRLQTMQEKEGFNIVIIGCTNVTQHRFIHKQLTDHGIALSLREILSFEQHTLSPQILLEQATLDVPDMRVICMMNSIEINFSNAWYEQVVLTPQTRLSELTNQHLQMDKSFLRLRDYSSGPLSRSSQLAFPISIDIPYMLPESKKQKFSLEYLIQNTDVQITLPSLESTSIKVEATTSRLRVRPVTKEDIAFYQDSLWGSAKVMEKFGAGKPRLFWPGTEEIGEVNYAQMRISDSEYSWTARWADNNPWAGYTVELRETGEKVGHVVIGGGELSYLFTPEVWGNGYGTEAVAALTNVILPKLIEAGYSPDAEQINATVRQDHIGSQRVMEKSSFTSDFVINRMKFGEEWYDRYDYKADVVRLQQNYAVAMTKKQQSTALVLYRNPETVFQLNAKSLVAERKDTKQSAVLQQLIKC